MSEPGIPSLLKDHARTFSLTLRLLPKRLREPLGIAYLLARASDTVADEGKLPLARRLEILGKLHDLLRHGNVASWEPSIPAEAFSPGEWKLSELLAAIPRLLRMLESLPDREEILGLWQHVTEGQLFDLQRFEGEGGPLSREELERYCYLVAGCVGETWTRLIARHASDVLTEKPELMISLGCSYGKGLQLLNILRDRSADRAGGRHYVCEAEIAPLCDLTESWLGEGSRYLEHLRPGRILYATAIPHDLALPMLRAIRSASDALPIKVTRAGVRNVLARNLSSLWLLRRGNRAS
jgi:farnesyl-diphosphate farnesyltransferase